MTMYNFDRPYRFHPIDVPRHMGAFYSISVLGATCSFDVSYCAIFFVRARVIDVSVPSLFCVLLAKNPKSERTSA